mmetsp:Transcript_10713/g.17987  ORF Transcript_10713/g.17987 Transcript_10713/m.17987 type:complete len:108 (+) Transcript_10713:278-601(+)
MITDCATVAVIVLWIFFFKVYSGIVAGNIQQESVRASIYAVEVKGLPRTREEGAPNESEIKTHFSQFGPVHSVNFIRDTGPLLGIYQRAEQKLLQFEVASEILALKT